MQESNINTQDLIDLENQNQYEHLGSAESNKELVIKCIRRGGKVYRTNSEHIHMVQKIQPPKNYSENIRKSSFGLEPVDKVLSGESLYKTFSFEQSSNDEDTEKCIAFWRSVMEKNLAPIKCAIIESHQHKSLPEVEEESLEVSQEHDIKKDIEKLHKDYKNMMQSVLKDLQKKRLHETKLYGARCKLCESISSSVSDYSTRTTQSDVEEEMRELDSWSASSKDKSKTSQKNMYKRIFEKSNEVKSQKVDTNTYIHVDVIEEKTKAGVYTQWRRNKVESICACGNADCDCNTNPAIVSAKIKTAPVGHNKIV